MSYGKILEPENEPEKEEMQKKGDDFERILKLSLKAFFWTVTLLSFLLALYVTFFPYPAMKYYTNVGLNVRALETSEAYVKLNEKKYSDENQPSYDSKFADALLSSVNLSIGLMEDSIDKSGYDAPKTKLYAEKAEKNIGKYKSYKSLEQRSALLDAYYTSQVTLSAPAVRHVDFYSFNNYLDCMRVRIMAILKKDTEAFSYFVGRIEYPFPAASSGNILNSAGTFNILTSYLKTKLSLLGWDNVPKYGGLARDTDIFANEVSPSVYDFVLLYSDREYAPSGESGIKYSAGVMPALDRVARVIDGYSSYVLALSITADKSASLKNLYCAKAVTELIYTINNCLHVMNCYSSMFNESARGQMRSIYEEWDAKTILSAYASIGDWYNDMLLAYAALF